MSALFTTRRRSIAVIVVVLVGAIGVAVIGAGRQRMPPLERLPSMAVSDTEFKETIAAHANAAVVSGNVVELLLNGDQIFPAKLAVIRAARTSISYAEYFYAEGEPATAIANALAERCRAGVAVKILFDGVGSLSMKQEHRQTLEAAGCHVVTFRPIGASRSAAPTTATIAGS